MADSSSNDNADLFGGITPAPDSNDPSSPWNYNWLDPYGNFVAGLPDQMPGPLSLERINGPREFYTDPQTYFAMRDANGGLTGVGDANFGVGQPSEGWDNPIGNSGGASVGFGGDTMSGGGGGSNDLMGDSGGGPTIPDQFGHPNPLPPFDPAYRGELTQDVDRALKSAGAYMRAGGRAAAILGPELPFPLDALAEGAARALTPIGRALGFHFIRSPLAHFAGDSAFDQTANAIQDANNALGNQYMHDAGGLP